ncbi:MAG TPA: hypothetical protein VMA09_17110 [Candidatus Binataceae bacterium]|nr:hypothetical protein [Candidatus Binataceae bacterium]
MRGLPTEPRAGIVERIRPLPYFINNLFPGPRDLWISATRRHRIDQLMADDVPRLSSEDQIAASSLRPDSPHAVVLNRDGVLLGAIEKAGVEGAAIDYVNGGPQTARPEMTPALAAKLLKDHRYILITTGMGKYLGRYCLENSSPAIGAERTQQEK